MQRQQYWDWVDDVSDRSKEYGEHMTNGDDATRLYQQYAPAIFAYLRMHTTSREDAEDVLVDVFLAALESRYFLLLPEPAQRAWLWRVARNKTIDTFRKRYAQHGQSYHIPLDDLAEALYLDEHFAPEQAVLREEEYAQLRLAISKLPEAQQQVLWLRFVSGLRCTNIAKVLGRREGTVRSLLSRALNLLRNIYE